MAMKNPMRPGRMIKTIIADLNLTVTEAATELGVTRQTLNNLLNNDNASLSPQMALKVATVFGGSTALWLRMQAAHDAVVVSKKAPAITAGLKRHVPATVAMA